MDRNRCKEPAEAANEEGAATDDDATSSPKIIWGFSCDGERLVVTPSLLQRTTPAGRIDVPCAATATLPMVELGADSTAPPGAETVLVALRVGAVAREFGGGREVVTPRLGAEVAAESAASAAPAAVVMVPPPCASTEAEAPLELPWSEETMPSTFSQRLRRRISSASDKF